MLKRTKIIATLGPATDQGDSLENLLRAGVDLVRINFSHGDFVDHERRVKAVREISTRIGREIGVLADLQGPKIRVARFKQNKINLKKGDEFILDANLPADAGDETTVGIDYKNLPNDVRADDILMLDDGRIVLKIKAVSGLKIICTVIEGGILSNHKGINRAGGGLSAPALTEKDISDMKLAAQLEADYVAISFVRSAEDIHEARRLIEAAGLQAGIIAKIERTEALEVIDDIILASDAVMVARGDLGVEIGDDKLPAVQKDIIRRTRRLNRAVITATQMMESMMHSTLPTRADVFDVANAVLDGTDAVMLSAETATGDNPDKVVETMARCCRGAEQQRIARVSHHRMESKFERADEAIAMAAMYIANHMDIKAITALTESGSTTQWMSRIRSGIPIYALCRHVRARRRMTLYRGVYPVAFDVTGIARDDVNRRAVEELQKAGVVATGDWVILTKGDYMGIDGGTNSMKVVCVGAVV